MQGIDPNIPLSVQPFKGPSIGQAIQQAQGFRLNQMKLQQADLDLAKQTEQVKQEQQQSADIKLLDDYWAKAPKDANGNLDIAAISADPSIPGHLQKTILANIDQYHKIRKEDMTLSQQQQELTDKQAAAKIKAVAHVAASVLATPEQMRPSAFLLGLAQLKNGPSALLTDADVQHVMNTVKTPDGQLDMNAMNRYAETAMSQDASVADEFRKTQNDAIARPGLVIDNAKKVIGATLLPTASTAEQWSQGMAQLRSSGINPASLGLPTEFSPQSVQAYNKFVLGTTQPKAMSLETNLTVNGMNRPVFKDDQGNFYDSQKKPIDASQVGVYHAPTKDASSKASDPEGVSAWAEQLKDGTVKFANIPDEYRTPIAEYLKKNGLNVRILTALNLNRAELAQSIEPKFDTVADLAKKVASAGLTGVVAGRMRELIETGSLASLALPKNLSQDQLNMLGRFATEANLLSSAIAMVHGGARAAGSVQMMEGVKKYMNPDTKDLNVYLGNLDGAKKFIHGYATMKPYNPNYEVPEGSTPAEVAASLGGKPRGGK